MFISLGPNNSLGVNIACSFLELMVCMGESLRCAKLSGYTCITRAIFFHGQPLVYHTTGSFQKASKFGASLEPLPLGILGGPFLRVTNAQNTCDQACPILHRMDASKQMTHLLRLMGKRFRDTHGERDSASLLSSKIHTKQTAFLEPPKSSPLESTPGVDAMMAIDDPGTPWDWNHCRSSDLSNRDARSP